MMPVQAGFKQDTSRVEASYQRERSSQSLCLSSLIDYCLLAPSYLPLCGRIVGDTWVWRTIKLKRRLNKSYKKVGCLDIFQDSGLAVRYLQAFEQINR